MIVIPTDLLARFESILTKRSIPSVVRHKSLYYICHSCESRNPEKQRLDAASSAA